jgi:hypothetical protein
MEKKYPIGGCTKEILRDAYELGIMTQAGNTVPTFEHWFDSIDPLAQQAPTEVVWIKATRRNMRRSAILRDSVLPENHIHQWKVDGWDGEGVMFTNGILKEWWELEMLCERTAGDAVNKS